jgi:alkylated DNA repair dioxygenase AlkB
MRLSCGSLIQSPAISSVPLRRESHLDECPIGRGCDEKADQRQAITAVFPNSRAVVRALLPLGAHRLISRRPITRTWNAVLSLQFALFESGPVQPEGLRYVGNFVSVATEEELIRRIQALPLQPFQFGQFEGKRRVASFGYRYDYELHQLQTAEPIPFWLSDIVARVEAFGGSDTRIRQVLCTEYDIGVGIGWHRDKPHFDQIFGLSLGSDCKFRFRKSTGEKWDRFRLDAERRSLYMMCGASRNLWEHSIPAVERQRYSITFRTMVDEPAPGHRN